MSLYRSMSNKYIVTEEFANERLDRYLVKITGQVRNQVQHLIKERYVTVNGKAPSVHQWLHIGDEIVVTEKPKAKVPMPELHVIAETEDYLVVNKPVGVLVHPAQNSPFPRLTDALVKQYPQISKVGDPERPGIVHRLDRDVSGLLVVARTQAMFDNLKAQFQNKLVQKTYTALVEGVVEDDAGVIDFPISRSKTFRGRMAARPSGNEGKSAETRFDVVERFPHMTLLSLKPITGRMHQLRVHMKAFGHPLVGDTLYGRRVQGKSIEQPIDRIFLESSKLSFLDMQEERREYELPLSKKLENFLKSLRHEA